MRRELSKHLVIDACVARSAGAPCATNPTSYACGALLQNAYDICHKVVMTPRLKKEWDKHQSRFTVAWLSWMRGRKKLVYIHLGDDAALREAIKDAAATSRQAAEMLKDAHLVEAARATDGIIISTERLSRKLLDTAAANVPVLRQVAWLNPLDHTVEETRGWLEAGAVADPGMRLGAPDD